ncbi:MAG: DUF3021 domain-containing protein [Clostridia bacterium]|nr:DUF3021 domain-containing protein [Clostridia bacterium]
MKHPTTQAPVKKFFIRGLMFGGGGPLVLGIVYLCLHRALEGFSLSGFEVFLGILSTYVLAFIHAGSGVFHKIESWSPSKACLCQMSLLYASYILCYVLNDWLPFEPLAIAIFTTIFVVGYGAICLTVYLSIKAYAKRLNRSLR